LTGADNDQRPASGVGYGQVTIPLSSLIGVDDAPGELAGVGPIPASLARELMAQAAGWRRLLTDPVDGHLVTQQIKTYRPSAAMRRFVLARSGGVCSARGCGARHDLQLDHVIPFPDGPTSASNFVPQCPPDHNGKTHAGWVHVLDPESGALTQTSPLGRRYTTVPTPPVAATGRRAQPARHTRDPAEPDPIYFPTGEPPPDPADDETAPPDPLEHVDRWPAIAEHIRDRTRTARRNRRARQRATARAEAAERALIHRIHAELESATDYQLIAAINAEYLAEDLAA
ncbi:MAG TPA: HNH endonuclease signature motif containing protein, partial [Jiangellaceae bacterium]|nr:HNH endonuclease signature motif containing protein [Jiangellaceae bacterium]